MRKNPESSFDPKGTIRLSEVLPSLILTHLIVLFWFWWKGDIHKGLIAIAYFWLGLIALSVVLSLVFWVLDKVKSDPNRGKPNTPTLGGDIKIIFSLLLVFLGLWASMGLKKALVISAWVVGSVAGVIILFFVVLLLLPDKPKTPSGENKP